MGTPTMTQDQEAHTLDLCCRCARGRSPRWGTWATSSRTPRSWPVRPREGGLVTCPAYGTWKTVRTFKTVRAIYETARATYKTVRAIHKTAVDVCCRCARGRSPRWGTWATSSRIPRSWRLPPCSSSRSPTPTRPPRSTYTLRPGSYTSSVFSVQCSGSRVQGVCFRVQGSGWGGQGVGVRV